MNTYDEKFTIIDTILMAAALLWFISIFITTMV